MRRELELKLELSKSDVERLRGELPEDELGIGPPTRKKLRSIYFDTPEYDLHAAGISLRLRWQDGGWLQTVKADQHVDRGISNPIELEAPVDREEPDLAKIADKKIKRAVQKAATGKTLKPVFETVVERTTRTIKAQGSEIELAVDDGEIRTGDEAREVREAELELKAGDVEGLLLAAEKLWAGHELKLSTRSKAEHGYRLALRKEGTSTEPEKARPVRIRCKDTCAKAFAAILLSATRQILVNREVVLQTDDPNGAHQLRIGLRRLRSALHALRPLVGPGSLRTFEGCARDMGRCVGTLRDADVLISGIHAPAEAAASDKAGFEELREVLAGERQRRRDDVRTALRRHAWTKLQLYLTLWPHTLDQNPRLEGSVIDDARKVLRKAWRKAAKLGRNLEKLNDEHRHEMRKALKRLRYQAEFFAPLFAKRGTERFIERLKKLQDIFGYTNDVRMAAKLIELRKQSPAEAAAARAAGYAEGYHETEAAHVWRQAGGAWLDLKRAKRFWD